MTTEPTFTVEEIRAAWKRAFRFPGDDYTADNFIEALTGGEPRPGGGARATVPVEPPSVACAAESMNLRCDVHSSRDQSAPTPIPMRIPCPACGTLHIDEGKFATKPHHTHACQNCGLTWRPAVVATVGVRFLPGFKTEAIHEDEAVSVVHVQQGVRAVSEHRERELHAQRPPAAAVPNEEVPRRVGGAAKEAVAPAIPDGFALAPGWTEHREAGRTYYRHPKAGERSGKLSELVAVGALVPAEPSGTSGDAKQCESWCGRARSARERRAYGVRAWRKVDKEGDRDMCSRACFDSGRPLNPPPQPEAHGRTRKP